MQPGAAPITLARYTHTLPDAMERAREQLDAFLVRPLRMRRTTARAEIHSPLHSPGILIPVVMRDCGGFDAVSKTVVGLWSTEGSNPSPSTTGIAYNRSEPGPNTGAGPAG
jgi:hypothetical protein